MLPGPFQQSVGAHLVLQLMEALANVLFNLQVFQRASGAGTPAFLQQFSRILIESSVKVKVQQVGAQGHLTI